MHLFLRGESWWTKAIERLAAGGLCCMPFLPRVVEAADITKGLMVAGCRGSRSVKSWSCVVVETPKERGNVALWVGPKVTNCLMHRKPSANNKTTHTFLQVVLEGTGPREIFQSNKPSYLQVMQMAHLVTH